MNMLDKHDDDSIDVIRKKNLFIFRVRKTVHIFLDFLDFLFHGGISYASFDLYTNSTTATLNEVVESHKHVLADSSWR